LAFLRGAGHVTQTTSAQSRCRDRLVIYAITKRSARCELATSTFFPNSKNKKASAPLATKISAAAGLKIFCAFPLCWNGLRSLVWPQIMPEAVSMMGEASCEATNITREESVKKFISAPGFNLNDTSDLIKALNVSYGCTAPRTAKGVPAPKLP
jgi:hypothetical protein